MKLTIVIIFGLLSFSALGNSQEVCSEVSPICVSYSSDLPFNSKEESRFELKIESKDGSDFEFMKADLWMQMGQHGHGSSPLKIVPVSSNTFDVTRAYFVMKGWWQIRVSYKQGENQETLIIPVQIQQ